MHATFISYMAPELLGRDPDKVVTSCLKGRYPKQLSDFLCSLVSHFTAF